ncbi:MAG: transcriptional repressor [Candidatus Krumholzibacteria bacterium]|nr:transcriptional repressor [Candidatus Krumholzibacteria bacterium]
MDEMIERLKNKGVTLTPQRMAIVEYLTNCTIHPTVDDIYNVIKKRYPTMSKATVYSTLKLLNKMGEIQELSIRKRGKACFDPKPELHHHFLCRKCGRILDIELECPDDCPIVAAREIQGCNIEEVQAYLYGLCSRCANEKIEQKEAFEKERRFEQS